MIITFIITLITCVLAKPLRFHQSQNVRCTNANIRAGEAVDDLNEVATVVHDDARCGKYFQVVNNEIFCVSTGAQCRQKMDSGNTVYSLSTSHDLKPMTGDGFYAEGNGDYHTYTFKASDFEPFPMENPDASSGSDTGLRPSFASPAHQDPGPNFEWANAYLPTRQFEPRTSGTSDYSDRTPPYPEYVPNYFGGYEYLSGQDRGEFEEQHQNWQTQGHESEEAESEGLPSPPKSNGKHPLEPWTFNGVSGYVQQGPFGGYGPVKPDFKLGHILPKDKCEGKCSKGQLCIAKMCVDGPREVCGEGVHCAPGEFCSNDICKPVMDNRQRRLYNSQ